MKGKILILLLLVAVLLLGACAGDAPAEDEPMSGANVRAIQFVGYQVYSPEGKWLGEVESVLLTPETGDISYLVLFFREPRAYGRALMVTDPRRFIPIPWERFTLAAREDTLRLDADEMSLIPAPYLEKAPDSLSTSQASAIDDYWRSAGGEGN